MSESVKRDQGASSPLLSFSEYIGQDRDKEVYVEDMNRLATEFQQSTKESIFVYSERTALSRYQLFGIRPDDSWVVGMKNELAGENNENVIFSNDYIQIYAQPAGRGE